MLLQAGGKVSADSDKIPCDHAVAKFCSTCWKRKSSSKAQA